MEFHDLDVGADEELLAAQGGAKDTEERRRGFGSMSLVPQLLFSGLTVRCACQLPLRCAQFGVF